MATNPMQKKTRNAFILGMVITLLIAAVVGVFLYMQISNLQKELAKYQGEEKVNVYTLSQDVKSGQALDESMFTLISVPAGTVPENATSDIVNTLQQYKLSTTNGEIIEMRAEKTETDEKTKVQKVTQWKYVILKNDDNDTKEYDLYVRAGNSNNTELATSLTAGERAVYFTGNDVNSRVYVTVAKNAIIAKVNLKAKTVLTKSLITRADEKTTNDLREKEYNVISLPVELSQDEYVDIRLMLPSGEDYIVLSKKKVSIPIANGAYLDDTIKMNLTESEILLMSSAIIDSYQIEGSRLYAVKYVEAGIQDASVITYAPSSEVTNLIQNDNNAVNKAISGLRNRINDAISKYGDQDRITDKMEEGTAATQSARKSYLQSLSGN